MVDFVPLTLLLVVLGVAFVVVDVGGFCGYLYVTNAGA